MKGLIKPEYRGKTKILEVYDDFVGKINIVECCKIGPITNENYCPKCGKKIER